MRGLLAWVRRWGGLFDRRRREREFDEELESHLAMHVEDNLRAGMSPAEARREAERRLGNATALRETHRERRGVPFLEMLVQDTRYALRTLGQARGFTVVAVFTLALGTGAVTTMFSVIHSVLLNPFPYADPRGMVDVVIKDLDAGTGGIRGGMGSPEFRAYVDESEVFADAIGTDARPMIYRSAEGVEQFTVAALTPNSFRFLGVPALLGRTFAETDARAGAPPVVVLSHKAWMTTFSGDPGVLGRAIALDERPYTVIGVMPPRFTWHIATAWIPDAAAPGDAEGMRRGFWLQARLRPGISMAEAQERLQAVGVRLAARYPDRYPQRFTIQVITVIDWVVGRFRGVLYTLFGAVSLLLLIACCNVANLLLARATARDRELAIRSALGASRWRIVGQMLVESVLLAMAGGALGVGLAYLTTGAVQRWIPPYTIPVETEIAVSGPVLGFSLAVSLLTALVFGVGPALQATRRDVLPGLGGSEKGGTGGARHGRLRNLLVVVEVALSLVLLTGAVGLMRQFLTLAGADPGFNPRDLLLTPMTLPTVTAAGRQQLFTAAAERVRALPGVLSVGVTTATPPYGGRRVGVETPGRPQEEQRRLLLELCDDQYFATLGVQQVAGNGLGRTDVAAARRVAVINETLAREIFAGSDPVGQRVRIPEMTGTMEGGGEAVFEIVGVTADVRNRGFEEPVQPTVFVPYTVTAMGVPRLLVRTAPGVSGMAMAIRREIRASHPNVVQLDTQSVLEWMNDVSYARPRFSVGLMTAFAAIGLVLVGSGVFGVMAYVVSQQSREIGIRMALGADAGRVFRAVLGGSLGRIGAGAAAGGLASVATNRLIASAVWRVEAFDPATLAAAIGLVTAVGAAACLHPALRATRVDPAVTLRRD